MKWVRRIIMFLLILAIGGSGFMAFQKFGPWRDAQEELDKVKAEAFEADDVKTSFTTAENQEMCAFVLSISADRSMLAWGSSYPVGTDVDGKVQYFVTNGHVIEPFVAEGFDLHLVFEDNEQIVPEVVFYQYDSRMDMAILKLPEPIDMRRTVIIRDSSTVKTGEKCTTIGYPDKSSEIDSDFKGDISSQSVSSGVISKVDVVPVQEEFKTLQHDSFISHGNSGGPLFDADGFLIGMNTLGRNDSDSVNFAITSNEVMAVLDQCGVKYIKAEDYLDDIQGEIDDAQKKFDKKQKSKIEDAEADVTSNRNMFFIFAGAALLCAIILLILFIIGNKKVVMVGEQDDGKKSFLYCTKGHYAGQRYEVTGQTMTIGRDQNSCTIVFPEDAPGISSNHCSIYYDARTKAFVLTDNGSTYGTYMSDGRKLTKGVPEKLLPGDTFALADKTNEFKVDRE